MSMHHIASTTRPTRAALGELFAASRRSTALLRELAVDGLQDAPLAGPRLTPARIARVGYLAEALALRLGEPAAFARLLLQSAPMYCMAVLDAPPAVDRPWAFSSDERGLLTRHPIVAARILGRSALPVCRLAAEVALGRHERVDGTGYPSGLEGEEIPISARIVAAVEHFETLTAAQDGSRAFSDDQAIDLMRLEQGFALDHDVVSAFGTHSRDLVALRDEVNRRCPDIESRLT